MDLKIMDCTLRDGGFLNQWYFGNDIIGSFLKKISDSCIDYIECGYLETGAKEKKGRSKYASFDDIPFDSNSLNSQKMLVCMVDYGKVDVDSIPNCRNPVNEGIRVAFRKNDLTSAIEYCKVIKSKGYKVFVHPMNTRNYTTEEFVTMVKLINKLEPYAFYVVDSFGDMWPKDCKSYIDIVNKYLSEKIVLGLHFHNNCQQAIANSMYVASCALERQQLIFDTTICGVGRGGGNLDIFPFMRFLFRDCTELIPPFLEIVDSVLLEYLDNSNALIKLIFFVSAHFNCHPNYVNFLRQDKKLNYIDIYRIMSNFSIDKKSEYDENYIQKKYELYINELIE